MAPPIPKTNPFEGVGDIATILSIFKGSGNSSSVSESTQSNVSSAGINNILAQILGGSAGLASIASGQKAAGGYNSTTQSLLTNDLITRTAGTLAEKQAGSTTTRNTSNATPARVNGGDIGTMLTSLGINQLLQPSIRAIAAKNPLTKAGNSLRDSLGLGDTVTGAGTGSGSIGSIFSGSISNGSGVVGDAFMPGYLGVGDATLPGLSSAALSDSLGFSTAASGGLAEGLGAVAGDAYLPGALSYGGAEGALAGGIGGIFAAGEGVATVATAAEAAGGIAAFLETIAPFLLL